MAAKKAPPDNLVSGRIARAMARREFAAEVKRRTADQHSPNNTLLSPDELGGDYLLERGLITTDGGKARPITIDDLRNFSARVKQLQKTASSQKFRGGITAKQVIDRSWTDDRNRANKEIHMANPMAYSAVTEGGGQGSQLLVQFRLNASSGSQYTHHNVNVQFMNLGAVVASSAKKRAKLLTAGPLKFECSCPRFKFFFRYVATVAGYVAGRQERSFPKIRNPQITGVACKHALRVMQVVDRSPGFGAYIERAVQKFRTDIEHTEGVEKVADQRELAEAMRKENWRQRSIKTSEEKRAKRQAQPANQRRQAQRQKELGSKMKQKTKQKSAGKRFPSEGEFMRKMMTMGITESQARAAYVAAKAAQ